MMINALERVMGRKEYDGSMKANEYITKNFDDIWAAIIRMHVLLIVMLIFNKGGQILNRQERRNNIC